MRVTNQSMIRNSQLRLQQNLQGMERAREDIASGLRLRKMSDDPIAANEVVRTTSSMRALAQFQRNADIASARASVEEAALDQLTGALSRAGELAVGQASATGNAQTRLIAKAEVDQLIAYAVNIGNTKFGDDYVFGGTRSSEAPFRRPPSATDGFSALVDSANAPVNPSGSLAIEINDGEFVTPNHNGTQVFLDSDALESLRALSTALGNNDVAGITTSMDRLNASVSTVQSLIGTQGARINQVENTQRTLESLSLSLVAYRSDLRDTEVDKAMVELVGKQTLYQAAMSATSRILGMSLANYL
ncbi:MAG: flagellar hook-associated protein FlgL [Gemmatimonadota bacterium]